jgi:hypothetical protein
MVKLRDAGTTFYANATIRHRANLITELVARDGLLFMGTMKRSRFCWMTSNLDLGLLNFQVSLLILTSLFRGMIISAA